MIELGKLKIPVTVTPACWTESTWLMQCQVFLLTPDNYLVISTTRDSNTIAPTATGKLERVRSQRDALSRAKKLCLAAHSALPKQAFKGATLVAAKCITGDRSGLRRIVLIVRLKEIVPLTDEQSRTLRRELRWVTNNPFSIHQLTTMVDFDDKFNEPTLVGLIEIMRLSTSDDVLTRICNPTKRLSVHLKHYDFASQDGGWFEVVANDNEEAIIRAVTKADFRCISGYYYWPPGFDCSPEEHIKELDNAPVKA